MPWSDFGIDLALGSVIDRKATAKEYMFLPDYVFDAFAKINILESTNEKPIVKRTEEILLNYDNKKESDIFTPLIVFSLLAILIIILTIIDFKNNKRSKGLGKR